MRMNNSIRFTLLLTLWLACEPGAMRASAQTNPPLREILGVITNGPVLFQQFRHTTFTTRTQLVRMPPHLATNAAYATNVILVGTNNIKLMQRFHTNTYIYTNLVFDSYKPDSLDHHVWTNFLAHTNGRDMVIWSKRTHPAAWPTNPPVAAWNTNSLIWGMKGMTAISPCWESEGASGQVPLTALTRRHAYTRGHGMGDDGFNTNNVGRRAWFVAKDNSLVEAIIKRQVTRAKPSTNGVHRDYTILMFDRDLPASIEPMTVADFNEVQSRAPWPSGGITPKPVYQTEQGGHVSTSIAPLTVNTWKGGDSGSPNMLPMPGELVFFSGRSTSGPTPEMQRDIDELCRLEGLDPAKYQLRWADLSKFPAY
jgi:hypothetical protein